MQESGSKLLVSYLVLCTGQYSNGVKLSDVLPCSFRMLNAYVSYDVVDHSLTAICQAAYIHRFDVSLNIMVFVMMLVFIGRPEPDRQTHFWLLEVSITVLQPSSVNTISPRRVIYPLESDWSAHCCRTSSVKVMALSKIWYVLYPLGSTAFASNSRESQIGGSCLTSPRYIPK